MEHAIFIVTGGLTPAQRSLQLFMCLRQCGILLPLDVRRLLHTYIERLPSRQDFLYMMAKYKGEHDMTEGKLRNTITQLVLEKGRNFNLADIYIYILECRRYPRERRLEAGKAIFHGKPNISKLRGRQHEFCMMEYAFYSEEPMSLIYTKMQMHRDMYIPLIGSFGGRLLDILVEFWFPLCLAGNGKSIRLKWWERALAEDLTGDVKKLLGKTFQWERNGERNDSAQLIAMWCLHHHCPYLLQTLLELKLVDMSYYSPKGFTILHQAIRIVGSLYVQVILENGGACLVDTLSLHGGSSPLWLAIAKGDLDSLELLMKHGADPNMKFGNGINIYNVLEKMRTQRDGPNERVAKALEIIHNALKRREECSGVDSS